MTPTGGMHESYTAGVDNLDGNAKRTRAESLDNNKMEFEEKDEQDIIERMLENRDEVGELNIDNKQILNQYYHRGTFAPMRKASEELPENDNLRGSVPVHHSQEKGPHESFGVA